MKRTYLIGNGRSVGHCKGYFFHNDVCYNFYHHVEVFGGKGGLKIARSSVGGVIKSFRGSCLWDRVEDWLNAGN